MVFLHQVAGRGAVFAFFAGLPLRLSLEAAGTFILAYSAMQQVVASLAMIIDTLPAAMRATRESVNATAYRSRRSAF